MAIILGLSLFVCGMFLWKNKILCIIGIFHNGDSYDSRLNGIKFCNSNSTARNTSTGLRSKGE